MDRGTTAGSDQPIKYLSQFDLLQIRTRQQHLARVPFDVMNLNALQTAIAAPRQAFFGEEMHTGIIPKAVILFVRLIINHPFIDGNKRIAAEALQLFLQRNGYVLQSSNDDVLRLARGVALGSDDEASVEAWLNACTQRT